MQLLFEHWLGERGTNDEVHIYWCSFWNWRRLGLRLKVCQQFCQSSLGMFVKKMCKKQFFGIFHPAPILFYIKWLTNTVQPHILVLNPFTARMKLLWCCIKSQIGVDENNTNFLLRNHIIEASCTRSRILIYLLHFIATKSAETVFFMFVFLWLANIGRGQCTDRCSFKVSDYNVSCKARAVWQNFTSE